MDDRFSREALLIGQEGVEKLENSHVAVFGAGGVGGYVIEALARSGVSALDIIDGDIVSKSNINRQIIALESTIGTAKTEAAKTRLLEINPKIKVNAIRIFFTAENADEIPFARYDYVVDAIDTVTSKLEIIARAKAAKVPVITCMGAGNKLDPSAFRVADISKTSVCPLARVMRRELKKRQIYDVKAVYSTEEAVVPREDEAADKKGTVGRSAPGSMAFVPAAAGLLLAAEVVKDLLANKL